MAAVICVNISMNLNWVTCILLSGFLKTMRSSQYVRVASQSASAPALELMQAIRRSSWNCISSMAGSEALWQATKRYCEERVVFKKPLSKMQVTQFKFVEMLTQIRAAQELTNRCVRMRVAGEDATKEISMAKLFCGRMARFVADTCIQLHGGFGYMKESAAGRAFVDTRLMSIGGGADEVMMQYLAKMLGF